MKYSELQTLDIMLQKFRKNGAFKRNVNRLKQSDLNILFAIRFHDNPRRKIKIADVAKKLDLTVSAVMNKIMHLEKREFITKTISKVDRRVANLNLTEKAIKIVDECCESYYAYLVNMVNVLTPEEIETLKTILEKVNEYGKDFQEEYDEDYED